MSLKNVSKVIHGGRGFRYGGEEFAVVFSNKSIEEIQEALELVRQSIESEVVILEQTNKKAKAKEVSVTIMYRASAFSKSDRTAEDVIKAAG